MKKATRQHTKQHNSRLILQSIYTRQPISRADLARTTNLTRATVSTIVTDLIEEGLVQESGIGPSIGGKPPRLITIAEESHHLLCLDLSSDCFQGALINLHGRITHLHQLPVHGRTGLPALQLVYNLIAELQQACTTPILGIGISTPGLINPTEGIILNAVNLGWHDIPLKHLLQQQVALPVHIANDSHLAALAAHSYGRAQTNIDKTNNLVLLKIGQGIGAGIVLNGRLHYGEGFGAGEIGHIVVDPHGAPCRCGHHGCLETIASIPSLLQQASHIAPTWPQFVQAYQQNNHYIQEIAHHAATTIGTAVSFLIGILNIHHIVIAGEITTLGDPFLHAIQTAVNHQTLPHMAHATHIHYTTIQEHIALLGASALILNNELGIS